MSHALTNVLIVEDEPAIAELLMFTLNGAGWRTCWVQNARDAWHALKGDRQPHMVLLDWMLPDQTGLSLLGRIRGDRALQSLPIVMLTAKTLEEDRIAGLEAGADDYVTKPFSPRELKARVNALLRRHDPGFAQDVLRAGPIMLDPTNCMVCVDDHRIDIGHAEYKLLKFLLAHPAHVFSRSQLLDRVWGDHVVIEERTVDVHILRLRKALKSASGMIKTMRGMGYMLSVK
ncbi:response regulator [Herbaspirillum sp. HC18]|nr:response regulator [Herbaspirillum sp. HC18]